MLSTWWLLLNIRGFLFSVDLTFNLRGCRTSYLAVSVLASGLAKYFSEEHRCKWATVVIDVRLSQSHAEDKTRVRFVSNHSGPPSGLVKSVKNPSAQCCH